MSLPTDYAERKNLPIGTGVLDYFPDALAEVCKASLAGKSSTWTDSLYTGIGPRAQTNRTHLSGITLTETKWIRTACSMQEN